MRELLVVGSQYNNGALQISLNPLVLIRYVG